MKQNNQKFKLEFLNINKINIKLKYKNYKNKKILKLLMNKKNKKMLIKNIFKYFIT